MIPKQKIITYYESCECDYRAYWNLDRSLAMHAGYWDASTKNLAEALERENEFLGELAKITSSDYVLDAGCGVGGSAIFLAKRYRCNVVGITLSEKQTKTAGEYAKKHGVKEFTSFKVMDFCHTEFPNSSFDVVWGLESICHAPNKKDFIEEAFRILKKGGRLIIADGFAIDDSPQSKGSKMDVWLKGWGVEALETVAAFECHLANAGFKEIQFQNITPNVLPSSRRLYWISFPAGILSKLGEYLGMRKKIQTDNIKGAYYQYKTLKKGLWVYGVFSALKR